MPEAVLLQDGHVWRAQGRKLRAEIFQLRVQSVRMTLINQRNDTHDSFLSLGSPPLDLH